MATSIGSLDFSQIIENSLTGIILLNQEELVYANQRIYQLLGYSREDTLHWKDILHPEYKKISNERLTFILKEKKTTEAMEQRLIRKDGSIIHVEVFALPYIKGNEVLAQVHINDITKRKVFERESLLSEKQYQLISQNTSDVIVEISLNGIILYVSPSATEVIGVQPSTLIGCDSFEFVHPDDISFIKNNRQNLLNTEKPYIIRFRLRNKIWVESKAKIVKSANVVKIVLDMRDCTEQMKSEQMLRQSEKLALIGELSAGVVHEIKNPLTSIKGFLQLMQAGTIKTTDYISILNTEIERIEQIANDLLGFAKPVEELKAQNIGKIIDSVVFLLNAQSRNHKIDLIWNGTKKTHLILGDESQMKQVFVNLIKNAIEASEDNEHVEILLFEKEEKVFIQIKDNGCGIPADKLDQVGDSFFTTKEKGTGLGLMVTRKIIHNHKGEMSINSQENVGTTFTVILPKYK
ncbi:PAS domain S-box protein [Aquibacillus rhizosphaerae]|uniref:histidine kinase n=1 Tax=Aquibacillus rhizosphaerae TaxID=3051431 RepID=A0ABT7L164_9BACI|nr:PAS domain S-box protein [Aquibacillus sp. LR5S19]MDL4839573.1 PAS domain S-box protein [Aquibacillus sp. LR5S19]